MIGMPAKLALRDAVLMNGMLVHGLEYDDTAIRARIHPSAFAVPCALGVGTFVRARGKDVLAAYIAGVECALRIGMAARGGFSPAGFNAVGIVGAFGSVLVAGKLLRLEPRAVDHGAGHRVQHRRRQPRIHRSRLVDQAIRGGLAGGKRDHRRPARAARFYRPAHPVRRKIRRVQHLSQHAGGGSRRRRDHGRSGRALGIFAHRDQDAAVMLFQSPRHQFNARSGHAARFARPGHSQHPRPRAASRGRHGMRAARGKARAARHRGCAVQRLFFRGVRGGAAAVYACRK